MCGAKGFFVALDSYDAALRRPVAAEAGEWRAHSLFDIGRRVAGALHARSPAAAAQLRRLAALAGVEVRVAPSPADVDPG